MKTILAAALLLCLLSPPPVLAQTTATAWEKSIGTSCNNYGASADFDTLAQCTSTSATNGLMQKAPLFVGQVTSPPYASTACDAAKAGMLQYVSGSLQYCNGTAWTAFSPGTGTASSLFTVITATVTGANGGTATTSCPAGYVLMSYGAVVDQRTQSGTDGWPLGTTNCTNTGGNLVANFINYRSGSTQSAFSCKGLCVANGIPGVNYLGSSAISTGPSRSDDITTGLFSATASTVSIATSGTERLRVTATGSVGIGTTSPAYLMHFYNGLNTSSPNDNTVVGLTSVNRNSGFVLDASASWASNILFYSAGVSKGSISYFNTAHAYSDAMTFTTNGSERLRITATGSVGIGTTSPEVALHLYASQDGGVRGYIQNASNGTHAHSLLWLKNDSGYGGGLFLNSSGRTEDGGVNTLTLRNDTGDVRIQGIGSVGLQVKAGTGNVGIGTTSPQAKLHVVVTSNTQDGLYVEGVPSQYRSGLTVFENASGQGDNLTHFGYNTGSGMYNNYIRGAVAYFDATIQGTSDKRLKKEINPLKNVDGLDSIEKLNPVSFLWKAKGHDPNLQFGFLAQEVKEVFPNLVSNNGIQSKETPDGTLTLNYNGLIAPTIRAVQELNETIRSMKAENDALRARLEKLEARVK